MHDLFPCVILEKREVARNFTCDDLGFLSKNCVPIRVLMEGLFNVLGQLVHEFLARFQVPCTHLYNRFFFAFAIAANFPLQDQHCTTWNVHVTKHPKCIASGLQTRTDIAPFGPEPCLVPNTAKVEQT